MSRFEYLRLYSYSGTMFGHMIPSMRWRVLIRRIAVLHEPHLSTEIIISHDIAMAHSHVRSRPSLSRNPKLELQTRSWKPSHSCSLQHIRMHQAKARWVNFRKSVSPNCDGRSRVLELGYYILEWRSFIIRKRLGVAGSGVYLGMPEYHETSPRQALGRIWARTGSQTPFKPSSQMRWAHLILDHLVW